MRDVRFEEMADHADSLFLLGLGGDVFYKIFPYDRECFAHEDYPYDKGE